MVVATAKSVVVDPLGGDLLECQKTVVESDNQRARRMWGWSEHQLLHPGQRWSPF